MRSVIHMFPAVIYIVYFSVLRSMRRTVYGNLHRIFLCEMIHEAKIYGSVDMYAVYVVVSPFISRYLLGSFVILGMVHDTWVTH